MTTSSSGRSETPSEATIGQMRDWIRRWGRLYLTDPNVTSVGIGYKETGGERTEQLCLQFTVGEKLDQATLGTVEAGTRELPERVSIGAAQVPTDVLVRHYAPSYEVVPEAFDDARRSRVDPLRPGVSISHPTVSAGTAGAIVHDRRTGEPVVLSNWHVLHGPGGEIGDEVLQPGTHDDNSGSPANRFGALLRSHLGAAGDAALASLTHRRADPSILDLDVVPEQIGDPDLGDQVVKSGRTTGISHGVVTRIHTMVSLDYGDGSGVHSIGCFEIEPDPRRDGEDNILSDGGDSGAVWMLKAGNGHVTRVMAGLHFAGADTLGGPERALACYGSSVRDALGFSLAPESARQEAASRAATGFDPHFLAEEVTAPQLSRGHAEDAVEHEGSPLIPYTHFSLVLSSERRFARFVAWNIDGARLQKLSRDGIDFRLDDRLPPEVQAGDDLYGGNDLDRGHIARRADLVWGEQQEAQQANVDSFTFTNIAPQMNLFNQSGRGGVWGQVEDSLFEQVEVQELRASVIGGPIFHDDDREYRGFRIPREFFKVVYYRTGEQLLAQAFVLTQDLTGLERLDLSDYSTYLVTLTELTERTGLTFTPAVSDGEQATGDTARAESATIDPVHRAPLGSTMQIPW